MSIYKRVSIDMENHAPIVPNRLIHCCSTTQKYCSQLYNDLLAKNQTQSYYQDNNSNNQYSYTKDELVRDLFLWSVFLDMPEMAKTLLVHLKPRICAALIASARFKRYAKGSTSVDHTEKFKSQSLEFESYAALFIDKCYEYNGDLACELLLRQIPLFGNVTCVQVIYLSDIHACLI
jgi:hypothetical protein